jgi:hypothetical protein
LRPQVGGEIADVIASPYLSAPFGRGRLGELLKARIIPKRIEHRIEP